MGDMTRLTTVFSKPQPKTGQTRVQPSQPLDVIVEDGLGDPHLDYNKENSREETSEKTEQSDDDNNEDWGPVSELCEICQISAIVGTCTHCGIYMYGGGSIYPEITNLFDLKVRRKH